ncbi:hypothetical protein M0R72_18590 [Candidatus Pacearchaeota archaeon]|jgi:hypothetical protein|nr:hypothetical protein [Candidatus Pacearchaeota archaeon]
MEDDRINWDSRAPHGETEETREVIRRYLPMREYQLDRFMAEFWADAEVEMDAKKNTTCSKIERIEYHCANEEYIVLVPAFALSATPKDCTDTLQTIIEREICRQASELPGTAWEVEYEGEAE